MTSFSPPSAALAALVAMLALAVGGCGGGGGDVPPAAEPAADAETTTGAEATTRVAYEYHDEFGHGHCSVTELAAGGQVVVCIAPTDRGTRIACFTPEEAQGSRNTLGLLRLDRTGQVEKQEAWPDECAEALAVVDPTAAAAVNGP